MFFNDQHGPKVEARKQMDTWVKRSVCLLLVENGVYQSENEKTNLLIRLILPLPPAFTKP